VLGVANRRSIAWAIARRLAEESAGRLTYQGERIEKSVATRHYRRGPLVTGATSAGRRSRTRLAEVGDVFGGGLDVLVHSIASRPPRISGRFVDTPRDRFWMALDIAPTRSSHARGPRSPDGGARRGSILTMTYLGREGGPHYNVMGVAKSALDSSVRYLSWDLGFKNIRVNAISAGPVRTLAARSIAGFTTMEEMFEQRAPLHRQIEADDCGAAAAYLLSEEAANVTGTTLYVDAGYHSMGM
jgi:enoyl-[acyl-carrier protein] reductase I